MSCSLQFDHSLCGIPGLLLEVINVAWTYTVLCVCVCDGIDEGMKASPCDLGFIKEKLMSSPVCLSHFFSPLHLFWAPSLLLPISLISLSLTLLLKVYSHSWACCFTHMSKLQKWASAALKVKISNYLVTSQSQLPFSFSLSLSLAVGWSSLSLCTKRNLPSSLSASWIFMLIQADPSD